MKQIIRLQITGGDNYTATCNDFLNTYGLKKIIGFSGSADTKLSGIPNDDPLQQKYREFYQSFYKRIISDVLGVLNGYKVAILTGGTDGGIPELAVRKAKEFGFKTIGVFPKVGKKYSLESSLIDLSIMVDPLIGESRWGDEGSVWTALVDAMIVISGQAGTLTECAHIQKINEALIKYNKVPKYIIPIYGTGGLQNNYRIYGQNLK